MATEALRRLWTVRSSECRVPDGRRHRQATRVDFELCQIEQMTALFVDMFGLVLAVGSYLSSRDELERARLDYEYVTTLSPHCPTSALTNSRTIRPGKRIFESTCRHSSMSRLIGNLSGRRSTVDGPWRTASTSSSDHIAVFFLLKPSSDPRTTGTRRRFDLAMHRTGDWASRTRTRRHLGNQRGRAGSSEEWSQLEVYHRRLKQQPGGRREKAKDEQV